MQTWDPRANDLFLKALEMRSAGERQEYLDEACAGDAMLRNEVESLLEASARAGSFLDSPVAGLALPLGGGVPGVRDVATIDEPVAERPGTVIGPYKLMEQIGEGGMGLVFVAEQQHPVRRKVAVKVIKPGMDTREVIARFEAERQALALMDHPNIARVFDAGTTESGRPYFVMELIRGVGVTQFCDENRLTLRERLELFVHVCQAVQHAHQKGIIHRDLKSTNILVTLHDGTPVVKVIDFGVAKAIGQQLTDKTIYTRFAQMIGTPMYMSPEQAELSGLDIDTRSDIYALGVLLYELLTGATPFDKELLKTANYDEIRRIVREEEPPRPSQRITTLLADTLTAVSAQRKTDPRQLSQLFRGELDWIVMKALEKDRNRRYETASAFAADVQRYLNDEPVLAYPPTLSYRLRKIVRRHKGPVLAVSLVVLALVGGIIGTTWGMLHATDAQAKAESETKQKEDALTAAQESKRDADLELLRSYLAQARAGRMSRRLGQRFDGLAAIRKALDLPVPEGRSLGELRNEAIACLALPDLRLVKEWDDWPTGFHNVAFDAALERYARTDKQGRITVRQVADDRELFAAEGSEMLALSPDGEFLASWGEFTGLIKVWRVGEKSPRIDAAGASHGIPCGFSPDSRQFALTSAKGAIDLYDLATGQARHLADGPPSRQPAFDPQGKRLAVSCLHAVQIRDMATGELLAELLQTGGNQSVAWHPDGARIAAVDFQRRLAVWDVASRKAAWSAEASRNNGVVIAYSPGGELLLSNCWNSNLRLWHPETGQQLLRVPWWGWYSGGFRVARDGRRLVRFHSGKLSIWEISFEREYQTLVRDAARGKADYYMPTVSPDGRLLAAPAETGVVLWDLESGKEVAFLPTGRVSRWAQFGPGGTLMTSSETGMYRWPLTVDLAAPARLRVGPPERMPYLWTHIASSRKGRIVVDPCGPTIHDLDRPGRAVALGPVSNVQDVAVSPDGRWVATTYASTEAKGVGGIRILDAQTGKRITDLALEDRGDFAFSPDNAWLATSFRAGCRLWRTADWTPGPLLEGWTFAFAPNSESIVIEKNPGLLVLWQCHPPRELARFEAPDGGVIGGLSFTPDGTRLIGHTADPFPSLRMWDLREIRRQLRAMGLDWDASPLPAARPPAAPLEVQVDLGSFRHEKVEADRLVNEAYRLREGKKHSEALAVLRQALKVDPTHAMAHNNLAWQLLVGPKELRDPKAALPLARKAVELASKSLYLNTLGVALYRNDEYKQAALMLEKSLAARKGKSDTIELFFLAMCHHRLGGHKRARDCYDRAAKWFQEQRPRLHPNWVRELTEFQAEADAVRAEPSRWKGTD